MSGCRDKVVDVFVTKGEYDFDEEWVSPVISVSYDAANATAIIVNDTSEWVLLSHQEENQDPIKRGDLVRIGSSESAGYTDVLTVLETATCSTVTSAVTNSITLLPFQATSAWTFVAPTASTATPTELVPAPNSSSGSPGPNDFPKLTTHRLLRLNYAVNATLPPRHRTYLHLQNDAMFAALLEKRASLRYNEAWASTQVTDKTSDAYIQRTTAFPLFRCKPFLKNGRLRCTLDNSIKGIHWLKLMGYSVFEKRQVGYQHAHEMIADDWIAMHVDQVPGEVVSNNRHAHGSFAVLHVGNRADEDDGAVAYQTYDPQGLYSHVFDGGNTMMRSLDLSFNDRQGEAAHFGRIHLWFRLCVRHG